MLLVDRPDGYFDPRAEHFTTVLVEDIGIPQFEALTFRYTLLELSTAVKPFFLKYLFATYAPEALCYFDPDIYFYYPLDALWEHFQNHAIVLTPHLTGPLDEIHNPDELSILRSGVYNLGFIGLARQAAVMEFLDWWAAKLTRYCVINHDRGFFVDQRWIDLVPGRFPGVYIEQDPGCNVAYWNLYHREVVCEDGKWLVNGVPLKFFHFSGFSPDHPDVLSKYQDRYEFADLPQVYPLFAAYRQRLLSQGYDEVKSWPNVFYPVKVNGVVIPDAARHLWRGYEIQDPTWNPFGNEASDSSFLTALLSWLDEPVDEGKPLLTRLAIAVYQQQAELQQLFPDVWGRDRVAYARWYVTSVEKTFQFDSHFVEAMARSLETDTNPRARAYQGITRWLFAIGLGPHLERILGAQLVDRIRDFFVLRSSNRPPASRLLPETTKPLAKRRPVARQGVNIIGYLCDETGVGESVRATMRALGSQGFPLAWTMVKSNHARQNDRSVLSMPQGHPFGVNLFYVNADQMMNVYHELGPAFFAGKYNIAYWAWELDRFPIEWYDRFRYLDEIWVGSRFVQNTLAHVAPLPVVIMGVGIDRMPTSAITRAQLGLPEDRFLFFFAYDTLSIIERKNPYAVIEAYRRAFGPDFAGVQLVIKVTKLEQFPEHAARLRAEMADVGGILIDHYLDRPELDGLFQACDTYVSLHRSEGFGMTLAEAMCMGKPVIATDYSGNTDFMNVANSYPVAYTLVELDKDYGPYQKGQRWAEPDVDHAALLMRHVFEHYDEAQAKGLRAAADIAAWYGREAMAQKMIARLKLVSQKNSQP